jgi:hypothetical protein
MKEQNSTKTREMNAATAKEVVISCVNVQRMRAFLNFNCWR